jgi:hypothetical protein
MDIVGRLGWPLAGECDISHGGFSYKSSFFVSFNVLGSRAWSLGVG